MEVINPINPDIKFELGSVYEMTLTQDNGCVN